MFKQLLAFLYVAVVFAVFAVFVVFIVVAVFGFCTVCCMRGVGGLVECEQSQLASEDGQPASMPSSVEASPNSKIFIFRIDAEGNHQTSFQNIHSDTT